MAGNVCMKVQTGIVMSVIRDSAVNACEEFNE